MAIKVNGTTVINDSRALNNITSVDSTTVAALGSAGVGGGATSLITGPTSFGSTSAFSLSLSSSYDVHHLEFEDIVFTAGDVEFNFRLGDTNGSPITTSEYLNYKQENNDLGTGNNSEQTLTRYTAGNYSGHFANFRLSIFNAASTSLRTSYQLNLIQHAGSFIYTGTQMNGCMLNKERNADIDIYPVSGTFSGSYRMWGVNL